MEIDMTKKEEKKIEEKIDNNLNKISKLPLVEKTVKKVTVVSDELMVELVKVLGAMQYQQVFGVLDKLRQLKFYDESEVKIEKKEPPFELVETGRS